jgi:hypothetical protein
MVVLLQQTSALHCASKFCAHALACERRVLTLHNSSRRYNIQPNCVVTTTGGNLNNDIMGGMPPMAPAPKKARKKRRRKKAAAKKGRAKKGGRKKAGRKKAGRKKAGRKKARRKKGGAKKGGRRKKAGRRKK